MYIEAAAIKSKSMDIGSLIKCVLIAVLILAGYFVVSNTAAGKV
jgi:hypothetical protein